MSVNQKVWAAEIKDQLFPNNSVVNMSENDDKYATAESVVLPIAGGNPKVLLDNNTYPLVPERRVDTVIEYTVSKLETVPTVIVGLEELSLSYDKRLSVQKAHVASLNTKSATYCINQWSPQSSAGGHIIRTTGGDRTAIVLGATGLRKMIMLDNIITAAELMDADDIDEDGRLMFLPAKMKNDLFRIADIKNRSLFGMEVLPNGNVNKIMGFKVMYRSLAGVYNAAATASLNMLAASPSLANSNAAALFYHPNFVRKGFYDVQPNIGQPMPEYSGGQSMNAIMKMGASPAYANYRGVVALVEGDA